jgi:hypothetical protein
MADGSQDYTVGYGRPPVETRFQKGQSGNPLGRPRTKRLVTLLGEALSRRSGFANPDGTWMTQAETILGALVGAAAGTDLKAKRLLFDVLVKLQRADICWVHDRLPEVEMIESEDDAREVVAAEMERMAEDMRRDAAARGILISRRPDDRRPAPDEGDGVVIESCATPVGPSQLG